MIIDVHGRYTTAPAALGAWRDLQIAALKDPSRTPDPRSLKIIDVELRESIETYQIKLMKQRGSDLTVISPLASFMALHIGDFQTSSSWAAICNELCWRVLQPFTDHFIGAAMLPQAPGITPPPASQSWSAALTNPVSSASTSTRTHPQPLDQPAVELPPRVPDLRGDGRAGHPEDSDRHAGRRSDVPSPGKLHGIGGPTYRDA